MGRTLRVWKRLERELQASGQSYMVYFTRYRGDGINAAEQARMNGAELIVGVGGDGTLLEIVNGIDPDKNTLGIIPAGTGNGFYRSLNIPGNPYQALLGLARWKPRRIDLGNINGTNFLNVVGFGFDAAVTKQATLENKVLRGYAAYTTSVLTKIATFHSFPSTVVHDKHTVEERETFLVVIANGRYYGGKLCIAPRAVLDDGLLDLGIVRKSNPATTAALVVKAFFKKHTSHKAFFTASCKDISVSVPDNTPVHVDGDIFTSLRAPARISVKPGAIQILAPPAH